MLVQLDKKFPKMPCPVQHSVKTHGSILIQPMQILSKSLGWLGYGACFESYMVGALGLEIPLNPP
jgi:hypothetical protein